MVRQGEKLASGRWLGRPRVVALVLMVWTTLVYSPAIRGPFFFDDESFILKNKLVHSLAHVPEIYSTSVTEGAAIKGNFYRPNQQLAYALTYSVFGDRTPVPYHLLGIMIHALNGVLVLWLLLQLGLSLGAATAGAALFLIHPAQSEAIAYISGLADPLACAFMLAALVLWIRPDTRDVRGVSWKRVAAVSGLMIGALFTKENGVVLAPLILITTALKSLIERRRPVAAEWAGIAATALLATVYSVMKLKALGQAGGVGLAAQQNAYTESLAMRLTTFVSVLWDYARLVVWPEVLNYEKPYTAYSDLGSMRGAFGIVVIMSALLVVIYGIRRAPRLALGALMAMAGISPFVGIVPLNAMWLEHWLYVPMIGLAVLLGLLFESAIPKNRSRLRAAMLSLAVVVAASWSVRTAARAREWADPEAFYLNEIAQGMASVRVTNNLAMHYDDKGNSELAIKYYVMASEGGMRFPQPHHNLARLYAKSGRVPEAITEVKKALDLDPRFIYSLKFLHEICVALGDQGRARLVAEAIKAVEEGSGYDYAAFSALVFSPRALPP